MMPNTVNARLPLVSLFLLLALFVAMGDSTAGNGSSDGTQLKESAAGESEAEMAPPMEGNPTAHEPWNTGTGLRVLLAIPCFHFNRSHVNFALAFYRILRKQHSVHVLVPYAKDKHIEFLRKAANKDDRMNNDLEFFDLKNSQIKVQVERKEIGANGKPTGKKVESTEEFGDILKHPNFENDFEHYPVGWSSLPWKEVMASKYGIKEHGKHVPQNLSKYDVGIAEFSWPNRHALALFHALGIEHTIVTHAYTPESHNYQDLGMLEAVIKAHIPSVHNSKLGDIFLNKEHDFRDKTAELVKRYAEIKEVHSRDAVKITEDIVKQDEDFANIPGFANFKLLDAFYNADYYFANTISELEFDGGAVLKMSQQERLHEFHKMLNAQKKLNAHHRAVMASIDTSVQQRLPEVTMVGGVHIAHLDLDSKKLHEARLSEAIEEKLREHGTNKGIVLISFGSVLKTQRDLTHVHFEAIRAVIKQNPDLFFIWQLTEGDKRIDTVNAMSNAYADKWLDLVAILADHRLKAFLSHCGRNSQFEATKFGVPTICVPFFNDQFYNAVVTARSGRGTFLDFFCLELQNKQYELVVTQYHPVLETESTLAIEYDDSEDELHKKFLAMMQESLKQWDEREAQKAPAEKAAHGSPFKQIAARNDCFTKANIHRTLHEAIDASNGHSSGTEQKTMLEKAHSSIEASKLKAAKDSIREHPAESVVMAAVKKISEKIKNERSRVKGGGIDG